MIHRIKLREEFADAVYNGEKSFEVVRNNDRCYQKGDTVIFTVIDDLGLVIDRHPLNGVEYEITYVLSGWGLSDNIVAFAIKRKEE